LDPFLDVRPGLGWTEPGKCQALISNTPEPLAGAAMIVQRAFLCLSLALLSSTVVSIRLLEVCSKQDNENGCQG
jgi:hypothetical protein